MRTVQPPVGGYVNKDSIQLALELLATDYNKDHPTKDSSCQLDVR